jgi:four helix bundle protein
MMDIRERTFEFALLIVELYKFLIKKKEFIMSKQLLKAGTSIGANVEEAQAAQSKKDFISKMSISSKEARETKYWLKLLDRSSYLNGFEAKDIIMNENEAIIQIVTKIVKTSLANAKRKT